MPMFKPNSNQDRRDYGEMLTPPEGYVLDKAVGTTYSLDLESLAAVAICLGLTKDTDSKLMHNPISMLNALQKVSDKMLIFCEAGQIKMPVKASALSLLLDKMVVPVALPKDRRLNGYPAFHPKTWTLSFVNGQREHKYRFIVMSRNLTFDRSWDISFAMESSTKVQQKEKTQPIRDFLAYLRAKVHNTSQNAGKKRNLLKCMLEELQDISFALDSREFGEDFEVLPMGIGANAYDMTDDILFCDEKYSADYTFHELVIMSPFLTGSIIESFNVKERGLTGCKRTLLTRRSELDKLKAYQTDNFRIYSLKDELIDGENYCSGDDDDKTKSQQDIHAKIYLRRKDANTDLYFGSMNASYAALHKNVEMMVRLGTKNRYLNGEKFLSDIFCGPEEGENNPFERVMVQDAVMDVEAEKKNALELKIKHLCRISKKAIISEAGDYKYNITIQFENIVPDPFVQISPFRSKQRKIVDQEIVFEEMELLQISEFYEVTVSDGENLLRRIMMIPTSGIPEEREQAVVNSVVKSRNSFIEYVAFVLGDDYIISLMERKQIEESGFFRYGNEILPALYEKMLKASLEAPERLKEIGYILRTVTDKEIIPDEFREVYEVFCKVNKIK